MSKAVGSQLTPINNTQFQALLMKQFNGRRYGYPCNKASKIIQQAIDHSEQKSKCDNRYYTITIDGVIVSVLVITYKKNAIHVPYMFIKIPYITDYETVISKLLSISPKSSDYESISIDVSALTLDIGEIDFDKLNALGFRRDENGIYTKLLRSPI